MKILLWMMRTIKFVSKRFYFFVCIYFIFIIMKKHVHKTEKNFNKIIFCVYDISEKNNVIKKFFRFFEVYSSGF